METHGQRSSQRKPGPKRKCQSQINHYQANLHQANAHPSSPHQARDPPRIGTVPSMNKLIPRSHSSRNTLHNSPPTSHMFNHGSKPSKHHATYTDSTAQHSEEENSHYSTTKQPNHGTRHPLNTRTQLEPDRKRPRYRQRNLWPHSTTGMEHNPPRPRICRRQRQTQNANLLQTQA